MGWKVTPYDDKKINNIYPENEIHIEGYLIFRPDNTLSSFCPCGTSIVNHPYGGRSILHSSFDGREYVERAQAIINKEFE